MASLIERLWDFLPAALSVVFGYQLLVIFRRLTSKKRGRSMSFNSSSMIAGNFPTSSGVVPPIITAAILFRTCLITLVFNTFYAVIGIYFELVAILQVQIWRP